ncbi:MAG TPA: universal stress protein [Chthoniobacterales bacterium]|jgi:nucleotide-binding universal stress UspA family protein|nr:universal stress protein [Chthoniobacterales bacterium]
MIDPPYRIVAVASTFSPRFMQVLAEAKRVRDRLCRDLHLIYVGERDDQTSGKFASALLQLALPADSAIHYQQAEDPAAAILQAASANSIDLIVAGALEKEVVLRPFLGNVARTLIRKASCSVMLVTKPESEPQPFRRIVFLAEYSEHGRAALLKVLRLADLEKSEKLYVIRVYTTFDEARAKTRDDVPEASSEGARTLDEEEVALERFIDSAGETDVPIEARCIRGNTGYAALDFIQSIDATLLAVPVDPAASGDGLPAHVAWITDVIPCNLWVIR